jgi:hypothetical protein
MIRDAALRTTPPGSTEAEVRDAVTKAGIGLDGLSRYVPPGEDGQGYILVGLDPKTFGLVKREYVLTLKFDRQGRLQGGERMRASGPPDRLRRPLSADVGRTYDTEEGTTP